MKVLSNNVLAKLIRLIRDNVYHAGNVDLVEIDAAPTVNSENFVTSGGVATALQTNYYTKTEAEQKFVSAEAYELIEDFTLAEDMSEIVRTKDLNNNNYNFKAIRLVLTANGVNNIASAAEMSLEIDTGSTGYYIKLTALTTFTVNQLVIIDLSDNKGFFDYRQINGSKLLNYSANMSSGSTFAYKPSLNIEPHKNITKIRFYDASGSSRVYNQGLNMKIYAIKA